MVSVGVAIIVSVDDGFVSWLPHLKMNTVDIVSSDQLLFRQVTRLFLFFALQWTAYTWHMRE